MVEQEIVKGLAEKKTCFGNVCLGVNDGKLIMIRIRMCNLWGEDDT